MPVYYFEIEKDKIYFLAKNFSLFLLPYRPEKSRKKRMPVAGKFYGHELIELQSQLPNLIPTRIISALRYKKVQTKKAREIK